MLARLDYPVTSYHTRGHRAAVRDFLSSCTCIRHNRVCVCVCCNIRIRRGSGERRNLPKTVIACLIEHTNYEREHAWKINFSPGEKFLTRFISASAGVMIGDYSAGFSPVYRGKVIIFRLERE